MRRVAGFRFRLVPKSAAENTGRFWISDPLSVTSTVTVRSSREADLGWVLRKCWPEVLRLSWGRGRGRQSPKFYFGFLPSGWLPFWPYLDVYKPGPTFLTGLRWKNKRCNFQTSWRKNGKPIPKRENGQEKPWKTEHACAFLFLSPHPPPTSPTQPPQM